MTLSKIVNEHLKESFIMLRDDFDRRFLAIAKATGGVLGFGKDSDAEKSVIADLRQAFDT